jgi:hypothetical protein
LKWGFHVAVYQAPCETWRCKKSGSNWGFFEVAEAHEIDFASFQQKVLSRNKAESWKSGKKNTYIKSDGLEVVFEAHPLLEKTWGIHRYGKREFSQKDKKWPLIWGPYVQASGDGAVRIKNPDWPTSLLLDYRHALHPSIQDHQAAPSQ